MRGTGPSWLMTLAARGRPPGSATVDVVWPVGWAATAFVHVGAVSQGLRRDFHCKDPMWALAGSDTEPLLVGLLEVALLVQLQLLHDVGGTLLLLLYKERWRNGSFQKIQQRLT